MELDTIARRYLKAVDALHTIHSSTDVHGQGGMAGQAITEHCALICNAVGGRFDPATNAFVAEEPPHQAVLQEYLIAKSELEEALLAS